MSRSVIVLGAGMVGVSIALHLQRRGAQVVLLDRAPPGEGASFGNAGLIQREAVHPHPFPRDIATLWRMAQNRSVDASYHPSALLKLAEPLFKYWWHSAPSRYRPIAEAYARLIVTCIDEHVALTRGTEAASLLRPIGWMRLYNKQPELNAAIAEAEMLKREHGVNYALLDEAGIAAAEPHLLVKRLGAVHWTDPLSVSDPQALTLFYARLFTEAGGQILRGDAMSLARQGAGWRVQSGADVHEAEQVVIALGSASTKLTQRFGYAPPLFGKRGYHRHYRMQGNAVLNHGFLDADSGFVLVPMRAGVRLTTGAEFAPDDAPKTPVQLARAEPLARGLLPLAEAVEEEPWMGVRPCTPDMLPIIGPLPGQAGAWCAFGHAHQGFTLGPTTGRLVAEMMLGEAPFIDPAPYRPARY